MPKTLEIERPTVRISRMDSLAIDNNVNTTFINSAGREEAMRTIETERFRVEFIASTPHELNLDWLHTKAFIRDGGGLCIMDSMRYGDREIEEYGEAKVIEWINEDRREMAQIIREYIGAGSPNTEVFDAEVRVVHKKSGAVLGSDSLHQCIYNSYEEFCRGGGYASDMVGEAIKQARDAIADLSL
jgi:hypothetical protein